MAIVASPIPRQAWSVLIVSTIAFTVCFMVWMMFGVIGIPLKKTLGLNATEFGLLTATPVLTGSLIRVPLGIWTDKYGGRIVMTLLMAATVPAIWLMSYATAYWHFLVIGLFVGLAFIVGRRAGCHTICWMAPFMMIGRWIRNRFAWPSLRLVADASACKDCKLCTKNCPMSLDVNGMVQIGQMENSECILCGTCVDNCTSHAIRYSFSRGK